jgi:hypothetical protein
MGQIDLRGPDRRLLRGDVRTGLRCRTLSIFQLLPSDGIDLDQFAVAARQRCGRTDARARPRQGRPSARRLRLIGRRIDAIERLAGPHHVALGEQARLNEPVHLRPHVRGFERRSPPRQFG